MNKILIAMVLLFSQQILASGVMVRPPSIDRCVLYPEAEGCGSKKSDENSEQDSVDSDEEMAPVRKKKMRRRRRRRIKNPCRIDFESEKCLQWKKKMRERRPEGASISTYSCRENPRGPRCLWAATKPENEVN